LPSFTGAGRRVRPDPVAVGSIWQGWVSGGGAMAPSMARGTCLPSRGRGGVYGPTPWQWVALGRGGCREGGLWPPLWPEAPAFLHGGGAACTARPRGSG